MTLIHQLHIDIVLLTDCVFSAELAPALVEKIKSLSGNKTEIYCCHEIRDEVSTYCDFDINF